MNLRKAIILGALFLSLASFSGCKKENKNDGKTKVVFELEGGVYQNCTAAVSYYYDLNEGKHILEPTSITDNEVERTGYELMGWYKTKKVNGDNVTYEDKWDFEKDQIDENGVTLYASWKKIYKHSFNVCYYDENNELQIIGTYQNVKPGEKFNDRLHYANKRFGYTPLGYYDEEGNEITTLNHPGGDKDLAINVIVKYIKGNYKIVKTASELKAAASENIYLLNDIDLGGEALNFENYKKTLMGNGHTISNFSVKYNATKDYLKDDFTESGKKSLYISLFGDTDGAHIENVTFKDVKVVVTTTLSTTFKIYVSPLCITSTNSSFQNVSFIGSFDYDRLPTNFNVDENLVYVMDRAYYNKDEESTFENVTIDVVNLKAIEE